MHPVGFIIRNFSPSPKKLKKKDVKIASLRINNIQIVYILMFWINTYVRDVGPCKGPIHAALLTEATCSTANCLVLLKYHDTTR